MDFFWLIFAHFMGDIPLQGEWSATNKGREPLFMIAHVTIWTGCVMLALQVLGLMAPWKCPFLFIVHYIMDTYKCNAMAKMTRLSNGQLTHKNKIWSRQLMYIDQLVHLGQLLCVYYF